MGEGKTKDWFGVHHFGFWVDDVKETQKQIEDAGGTWFMGEMEGDNVFYELKFSDPNGTIFDITHNGWSGARKDGHRPRTPSPFCPRTPRRCGRSTPTTGRCDTRTGSWDGWCRPSRRSGPMRAGCRPSSS